MLCEEQSAEVVVRAAQIRNATQTVGSEEKNRARGNPSQPTNSMKNQGNVSSLVSQDDDKANITSIRIVSVDHYMRYPVTGLDPCFSEFRATEVKQVYEWDI